MEAFKHIQILKESWSLQCARWQQAAFSLLCAEPHPVGFRTHRAAAEMLRTSLPLTVPRCIKVQGKEAPGRQSSRQALQVCLRGKRVGQSTRTDQSLSVGETGFLNCYYFLISLFRIKRRQDLEQCLVEPLLSLGHSCHRFVLIPTVCRTRLTEPLPCPLGFLCYRQ